MGSRLIGITDKIVSAAAWHGAFPFGKCNRCGINVYIHYMDMDYKDKDQMQEEVQREFRRSHEHLQCGDRDVKQAFNTCSRTF